MLGPPRGRDEFARANASRQLLQCAQAPVPEEPPLTRPQLIQALDWLNAKDTDTDTTLPEEDIERDDED